MIELLLWLGGYIGRFFYACYSYRWFSGNHSVAEPPVVRSTSIDDRQKSENNIDSSIDSEISAGATSPDQVVGTSANEGFTPQSSQDSEPLTAFLNKTTKKVETTVMVDDQDESDEGKAMSSSVVVQQSADELRYQTAIRILKAIKVIPESAASTISEEKLSSYTHNAISVDEALAKLNVNWCTRVVILANDSAVVPVPIQGTYYIQEVLNQPSKIRVYRSEDEELIEKIFERPPYISELITKVVTAGGTSMDPDLCQTTTILGRYNSKDRVYAKILGFGPCATFFQQLAKDQVDCQSRTRNLVRQFAPQQIERLTHLSAAVKSVYQFIWELLHPIHELVNDKNLTPEGEESKKRLEKAKLDAQKATDYADTSAQRLKDAQAYLEKLKEESEQLYPTVVEKTTSTRGFRFFNLFGSTKASSPLTTPIQTDAEAFSSLDSDGNSVDLTAASEAMDGIKTVDPDVRTEKKSARYPTYEWFTAKKAAGTQEESSIIKKKTVDSIQSDTSQAEYKKRRYSLS